jgi:hypothetical protein
MAEKIATKPKASSARRFLERCVFCLKTRREVSALIGSDDTGARICNECVFVCDEILAKNGLRFVPRMKGDDDG